MDCVPSKRFKVNDLVEENEIILGAPCGLDPGLLAKKHIPSDEDVYEKDLPLLANVDRVHVSHYALHLDVDPDTRVISGSLLIFLEQVQKHGSRGEESGEELESIPSVVVDKVILDCCTLTITKVEAVPQEHITQVLGADSSSKLHSALLNNYDEDLDLCFITDKWSLSISGWGENEFPAAIRIQYTTSPTSPSLHWRPSVGFSFGDGSPLCCFTPAASVNNRGLFPCQEPPTAMATWQCFVRVPQPYQAFLSSDSPAVNFMNDQSYSVSYFQCSQVLPMSTFSIFVTVINPSNIFEEEILLAKSAEEGPSASLTFPFRWIFQSEVKPSLGRTILEFTKAVLKESVSLLSFIPFTRLDVIVMPHCFPILGLANPSMIFLSPSLLTGEKPLLYSRLAHEIGHFWFGLSIGALDWTEEWIGEGFATFTEDVFYKRVMENHEEFQDLGESLEEVKLRPLVRLITLQNELENTHSQQELHFLQPNQVLGAQDSHSVKNGLEPMKAFMQVHYLKGYFYLKLLCDLVGENEFLQFLNKYVQAFSGKLVTSEDFLSFFLQHFRNSHLKISEDLVKSITQDWLRESKLPQHYRELNVRMPSLPIPKNVQAAFPDCIPTLTKINEIALKLDKDFLGLDVHSPLNSTEKLLLLELILSFSSGNRLKEKHWEALVIIFENENTEVLHRWCEIIIKFKCTKRLDIVRQFLLHHPAMGIYLYGELMISEQKSFQTLARNIYKLRKQVLDPPFLQILKTMIF